MADRFGGIFGNDFGDLFGGAERPTEKQTGPGEKGAPIHAREIDDVVYVRLEDVVALLENNSVLPKAVARFKAKLGRS